jgi:hypothetical protein
LAPLWKPKVGCDFPGCTKRHFALGYCQGHWRQLREKRPLAPLREMKGWRIDRGYVYLFEPTHPDAHMGNRSDNRPANLELWAHGSNRLEVG